MTDINDSQRNRPLPILRSQRNENDDSTIVRNLSDTTTLRIDGHELVVRYKDPECVRHLGSGNFASVYHMRLKCDKRVYDLAVKSIAINDSERNLNRIFTESEFGIRMSGCPFAVATYGLVSNGEKVRIFMELMDFPLSKLRETVTDLRREIDESHIAYIIRCNLEALEYLRQHGIQHRDVKPSNMLINRAGWVKICDYGVSQRMEEDITKTNVGTHAFVAPERLIGGGHENGFRIQSDVWSLGLSVYNIATGQMPYRVDLPILDYYNLIVSKANLGLPSESEYSQNLKDFVSACLVVKERDRPDFAELLAYQCISSVQIENSKYSFAGFVNEIMCDE